jgi:hypothetical protein
MRAALVKTTMDWFIIVGVLCVSVRGEFNVVSRSPNETVTIDTQEFEITSRIDTALIHFHDCSLF